MQRLRKHVIKWITVSLICLLLGFLLGKFKQDILLDSLQLMEIELHQLKDEKMELAKQAAAYQAQLMVDEKTITHLTQENKTLHVNMDAAANKLYFYERVIAPELEETGIKIFSFAITKNDDVGRWDYELVLMQAQKDRHFLKGSFDLIFSIFDDGQIKQITLSDLNKSNSDSSEELAFNFKYFQTLRGSFSLAPQVVVDELNLQVRVNKNRWNKGQELNQNYEWKSLTEKDNGDLSEDELEDFSHLTISNDNENVAPSGVVLRPLLNE